MEMPAVSVAFYALYDMDHFASESYCSLFLATFFSRLRAWEAKRQLVKGGVGAPMDCDVSLFCLFLRTFSLSSDDDFYAPLLSEQNPDVARAPAPVVEMASVRLDFKSSPSASRLSPNVS